METHFCAAKNTDGRDPVVVAWGKIVVALAAAHAEVLSSEASFFVEAGSAIAPIRTAGLWGTVSGSRIPPVWRALIRVYLKVRPATAVDPDAAGIEAPVRPWTHCAWLT
jgi:hypothetical protein